MKKFGKDIFIRCNFMKFYTNTQLIHSLHDAVQRKRTITMVPFVLHSDYMPLYILKILITKP